MSKRIDPQVRVIYGRLWHYVTPHKLIGFVAVVGMAATAIIEAGLVALLQPLTDEALVAKNLETAKWIPFAFMGIFILRGISGFATEPSLGWIGRRVISDLRRQVFDKFLTLPARFFDSQTAGPLLSRMTYNVEMVAESVTSVVTIAVRDILTVHCGIRRDDLLQSDADRSSSPSCFRSLRCWCACSVSHFAATAAAFRTPSAR